MPEVCDQVYLYVILVLDLLIVGASIGLVGFVYCGGLLESREWVGTSPIVRPCFFSVVWRKDRIVLPACFEEWEIDDA